MKIGVLALQGAFIEHRNMLKKIGVDSFEIRCLHDLKQQFQGLIIPGGESTVMGKLLHSLELYEPLKRIITDGFPVFGTCAGMILLAKEIANDERKHIGTMDIVVKRNAYGRQLGSFLTTAKFGMFESVPMPFIRAPYISEMGENVKALAVVGEKIVAAEEGRQLVTAFHPELTMDLSIHKYFIEKIVS